MAVYSMTGYASAQRSAAPAGSGADARSPAAQRLGLEIRSVNSRFLDLTFKLPDDLRPHEPALRELLTAKLKRGKVEVRGSVDSASAGQLPDPSPRLLQRLSSLQDNVRAWLPDARALSVADALRMAAVPEETESTDLGPDVTALAKAALKDLMASREREGVLGDFPGMTFAPRFAPDGRSLLLTLAQNGNSDIYIWDIANRRSTRLTSDAAIDTSPSFAPDGQRIVFNSDRGGRPLLYVMDRSGGAASRISFGEGRYGSPAWSPRGDLIAFMVIKGGMFSIGVMRPDGSDERLLTRSSLDESPTWAPSGRVIMFSRQNPSSGRRRLFTIDVSGYNEREVATPTDASDPDWSPTLP